MRYSKHIALEPTDNYAKDGLCKPIEVPSQNKGESQGKLRRQEKFAGLINDTVWKYNPESYYNKDADKNANGKVEQYQDQR